jgi:ankyrin repeat protein
MLHIACKGAFLGIVEVLLTLGADPSAKDDKGQTAESIARTNGDKNMLRVLQRSRLPQQNQPAIEIPDMLFQASHRRFVS